MSTNREIAIEFANKVRAELRHLTSEEIADLTDGLEADIASSLDDGADIGTAEKYASDLLSAAGLAKPSDSNQVSDTMRRMLIKVKNATESIADLAPAWWVFRAWVATQVFGFYVNHDDTGRPITLEWSEKPWLGFVIFVGLLFVSVKMGRSRPAKWQLLTNISHVLLALAGLGLLFAAPRTGGWFVYSADGSSPTTTVDAINGMCPLTPVPDVQHLTLREAEEILGGDFTYFYEDSQTHEPVQPTEADMGSIEIVEQFPVPGNEICASRQPLKLSIPLLSSSRSESVTSTIAPIPVGTTTTVKPKVAPTTAP